MQQRSHRELEPVHLELVNGSEDQRAPLQSESEELAEVKALSERLWAQMVEGLALPLTA